MRKVRETGSTTGVWELSWRLFSWKQTFILLVTQVSSDVFAVWMFTSWWRYKQLSSVLHSERASCGKVWSPWMGHASEVWIFTWHPGFINHSICHIPLHMLLAPPASFGLFSRSLSRQSLRLFHLQLLLLESWRGCGADRHTAHFPQEPKCVQS